MLLNDTAVQGGVGKGYVGSHCSKSVTELAGESLVKKAVIVLSDEGDMETDDVCQ